MAGLSYEEFRDNDEKVYAVIRALEIVGEAVKNIPAETRRRYPAVPWKDAAATRDKLIHGYFGIDLKRVWNTVKKDLPTLLERIKEVIAGEER